MWRVSSGGGGGLACGGLVVGEVGVWSSMWRKCRGTRDTGPPCGGKRCLSSGHGFSYLFLSSESCIVIAPCVHPGPGYTPKPGEEGIKHK